MRNVQLQRRLFFMILAVITAAQVYTKMLHAQSWEPLANTPVTQSTDLLAIHPRNADALFIGTKGYLYASFNRGKEWKQLLRLGSKTRFNQIYFDQDRYFLLTSDGLFDSRNGGRNWQKIFGGRSTEGNILSLSRNPNDRKVLYLGTEGGLFISHDDGRSWQKETNELAHQEIRDLGIDQVNGELFIASERGLYRSLLLENRLERVYGIPFHPKFEEIDDADEQPEELEDEGVSGQNKINRIVVAHYPYSLIALATTTGVFISEDEGNHWDRTPINGLGSNVILDLVYSPQQKSFFAATEKGVYFYDRIRHSWNELSEGLPSPHVAKLGLIPGATEILFAVTNRGIYRIVIDPEAMKSEPIPSWSEHRWGLALKLFSVEPAVGVIQQDVIRYANVSNWKTRRWQWTSRLRALVPSFSIGKDYSTSQSIDIDRGGASDPDRYILGPPDSSKSWNFDLEWNLSDLIWNSAQTSIDSRDKLMIELRNDLLAEATRLYFERRRAQAEFVMTPPEHPMDRVNQLLRIEELTASLDALSGGHLRKELSQIYSEYPELQELWK